MEVPLLDLPAPQRCKLGHCDGGKELDTKTFREGKEGKEERGNLNGKKKRKRRRKKEWVFAQLGQGFGFCLLLLHGCIHDEHSGGREGYLERSAVLSPSRELDRYLEKINSGHEKGEKKNKKGNS